MLYACVERFDVMGVRENILGWDGEVNKASSEEWYDSPLFGKKGAPGWFRSCSRIPTKWTLTIQASFITINSTMLIVSIYVN
jgi:hypothetical protein